MAKDVRLARDFSLSEFTRGDVTDYQLALLRKLASSLQEVRDRLQAYARPGKTVGVAITSGVRTSSDYERLKAKGYRPSSTSDHFCGLQLSCKPTLGAADLVFTNCTLSPRKVAGLIVGWDREKDSGVDFGQVIYERNPSTGAEWVHVSNDWYAVLAKDIADAVDATRSKYLMSLDNGRTYVEFREEGEKQ